MLRPVVIELCLGLRVLISNIDIDVNKKKMICVSFKIILFVFWNSYVFFLVYVFIRILFDATVAKLKTPHFEPREKKTSTSQKYNFLFYISHLYNYKK